MSRKRILILLMTLLLLLDFIFYSRAPWVLAPIPGSYTVWESGRRQNVQQGFLINTAAHGPYVCSASRAYDISPLLGEAQPVGWPAHLLYSRPGDWLYKYHIPMSEHGGCDWRAW